jgi:hypothetical protein
MQRRPLKSLVVLTSCLALVALAWFSQADAGGRANGKQYTNGKQYSKGDIDRMINRVETNSDQFAQAFNRARDRSQRDGPAREDRLTTQVQQFERALDGLRSEFDRKDRRQETRSHVQQVMQRAGDVERAVRGGRLAGGVEDKWAAVRRDLNTLAGMYDLKPLGGRN